MTLEGVIAALVRKGASHKRYTEKQDLHRSPIRCSASINTYTRSRAGLLVAKELYVHAANLGSVHGRVGFIGYLLMACVIVVEQFGHVSMSKAQRQHTF